MKEAIAARLMDRSPRILVVGDLMVDHYLRGSSSRISPEAPVPIVDVQDQSASLGGAGNVMNNLLSLGAEVVGASVIGDDPGGREILAMLQAKGIATDGILLEKERQTSRKSRVMVSHHQVVRFDTETRAPITHQSETELIDWIAQHREPFHAILLSDYNKGVMTPKLTQSIIRWSNVRAIPVLVDPKGSDSMKYQGATVITPNKKEASLLSGVEIDSEEALTKAGQKLRNTLGAQHVLITLSEEGMAIFGETMTLIPAAAREVYDVTGAGDTVLATLGFSMACQRSLSESAKLANSAAAVVVSKLGSATATVDEILQYDRDLDRDPVMATVMSADTIEAVAQQLRQEGKRIIFTNGCFDLLHRGHVEYLRASKACGDVLIVGINSDDSVRRLKGANRPIVSQDDRAFILSSLACVDYVVVFEEDTPYELIESVRPDVLTKGADYQEQQVVGHDLVKEVRLISLVEGRSTSYTIDRIQQAA